MMKNGYLLLCATALSLACVSNQAQASINFNLKAPPVPSYAKLHTSHTSHLMARHLSSPSFSERPEVKVAQVCFITDTEDCGGADFVGTDGTTGTPPEILPPGGDDYKESCTEMGYGKTSCPEGYSPNKFCPLDEKYFAECKQDCPTGCKECEEHYTGIGEECCPGKYMECECNECKGYDYTENNIPAGYIKGESCESCNGWKYKIIPNPCTGFLDCDGKCATGSKTCLSGDKTMCEKCPPCPNACTLAECPANAVCDKEECSGKYCRTGCVDGYEWDNASQSCKKKCENKCSLSSCPANAVCDKEECSGRYCLIDCVEGYELKNNSCEPNRATWGQCTGYAAYCEIGDIVSSDGICNGNIVSGKTPIAVVVYKSGNCAQALALAPSTAGKWAQKRTTLVTSLPYVEDWDAAAADVGSCANSKKLLAEGDATKFPAVWAAHNYSTAGTKVGDWCLPAAGIFTSYYNEQNAVNAGLARANGVPITEHEYNKTWSSTLWSEYDAWLGYFYQRDGLRYESKDDVFLVRPVLEF